MKERLGRISTAVSEDDDRPNSGSAGVTGRDFAVSEQPGMMAESWNGGAPRGRERRVAGVLSTLIVVFLFVATAFGQPVFAESFEEDSILEQISGIVTDTTEGDASAEETQRVDPVLQPELNDIPIETHLTPELTTSELERLPDSLRGPQQILEPTSNEKTTFRSTGEAYIYQTSHGGYFFQTSRPHIAKFTDRLGITLVDEASFYLSAPDILEVDNPRLVEASSEKYVSKYSMLKGSGIVGTMTIEYDFSESGPPKTTASVDLQDGLSDFDFKVVWMIDTTLDCVLTNGDSSQLMTSNGLMWLRGADHSSITLEYCEQSHKSEVSLVVDWSDGPGEGISLTRVEEGERPMTRIHVSFPENQRVIDPSLIDGSFIPPARDPFMYDAFYSMQRNTIYLNGYYWAFWAVTDSGLDQIWYSTSHDGMVWPSMKLAFDLPSEVEACQSQPCHIDAGLDIAGRSSGIVISLTFFVSFDTYFGVMFGELLGDKFIYSGISILPIDPGDVDIVMGLMDAQSVTIDTHGNIWTSVSYLRGIGPPPDWILVSTVWRYGRSGWEEMDRREAFADERYSIIHTTLLVPMSKGKVAQIWAESDDGYLRWKIWDNDWSAEDSIDAQFATSWLAISRARRLSAVSLSDDTLAVVYGFLGNFETFQGLRRLRITGPTKEIKQICDPCGGKYLTLSRDSADAIFAYWTRSDGKVRYWYEMDEWESGIEENLQAVEGYPRISSSYLATKYSFLTWSTDASGLWFASWPTPASLSTSHSTPYNNIGSQPAPAKYSHLDESISPSNGLLFIKSTDLTVPGKNGMDVLVSRFFRTPPLFREDLTGGFDVPYIFGDSPYADMGNGWQLNFPWIENGVLYLWDGVRFVLDFPGMEADPEDRDTFTNHVGMHFTLERKVVYEGEPNCFVLTLRSGMTYIFYQDGTLRFIQKTPSTQTRLEFAYNVAGNIDTITDTILRLITFEYTGGRLSGIDLVGVTEVSFEYDIDGNLEFVTDAVGRVTEYGYQASNKHLLSYAKYPTLALSEYDYQQFAKGTDAYFFAVMEHRVKDKVGSQMKKDTFEYKVDKGFMSFIRIERYGTGPIEKCDEYVFDTPSNSMIAVQRDVDQASGVCSSKKTKTRTWFDAKGQIRQSDLFIVSSNEISSSTSYEYDEWGNQIYRRDASGHEVWTSYANTKSQNSFVGGGILQESEDHNLVYDDFIERDLSDWREGFTGSPPDESNHLIEDEYFISPPSLMVDDSPSGYSREFQTHSDQLWVEVLVKVSGLVDHDIYILDQNDNPRARVTFNHQGFICFNPPEDYIDPWKRTDDVCLGHINFEGHSLTYGVNEWYVLGIHLHTNTPGWGSFDIYLDGTLVYGSAPIFDYGSLTFSKLYFRTEGGLAGEMWVDSVRVDDFRDAANPGTYVGVRISGLDEGQYAELLSFNGYALDRERADQSGVIGLQWWRSDTKEWGFLSNGQIRIYEPDGSMVLENPFRINGAKYFDFVAPRQESSLTKTKSGFDLVKTDPGNCPGPDDTCVLLDEGFAAVSVDDDFHSDGWLDPSEFDPYVQGDGEVKVEYGRLSLNTGTDPLSGDLAQVTSWDTFVLNNDRLLVFEASMSSHCCSPSFIHTQPRGLSHGTSDLDNAIMFRSWDEDTILASTSASGVYQETFYDLPDGKKVKDDILYRIEATSERVRFYIDQVLIASHTFNIPQVPMFALFWTGKLPFVDRNVKLEIDWLTLETMYVSGWPNDAEFDHTEGDGWDSWLWTENTEILGAHGDSSHWSMPHPSERSHEFSGSFPAVFVDDGDVDVIAQYVYIPEGSQPDEILLMYWCAWSSWYWSSAVYWGEDLIDHINPRYRMGDVPESGQWSLLLLSPYQASCDETFLGGVHYSAYGGEVLWDYSIIRETSTTPIKIVGNDLQEDWWVKFFDTEDNELIEVQVNGQEATFDPYYGSLNAKTYPLKGYFKVYDSTKTELIYWSPTYDRIWPGDEFTFTTPDFYPNGEIFSGGGYQDHPLGSLEFRFGRLSPDPESGPVKSFFEYDDHQLRESKAFDGSDWLRESYTYDPVTDNLDVYCDYVTPAGCQPYHETQYTYGIQYSNAYVTEVTTWAYSPPYPLLEILTEFGYDSRTGLQTHEINPNGGRTDYEYDAVSRLTKVTYPQIGSDPRAFETYDYDDDYTDGDGIEVTYTDEKGRKTTSFFDELGRTVITARLKPDGSKYDYHSYLYDWADQVTYHSIRTGAGVLIRDFSYEYDCLGRKVLEDYPDPLADRAMDYFDEDKYVEVTVKSGDEDWQVKRYHYDWSGLLVKVEELEGSNTFETTYSYDELGNLLQTVDSKAMAETIDYEYDSLSRLIRVDYQDLTYESLVYDDAGNLLASRDRRGIFSVYRYDTAHRLRGIEYTGSGNFAYIHYDNNGNAIAESFIQLGPPISISRSEYVYDERDRIIWKEVMENRFSSFGSHFITMEVEYVYDDASNLQTLLVNPGPNEFQIDYSYDWYDRIDVVSNPSMLMLAEFEYNEDNTVKYLEYGNGMEMFYQYYPSGAIEYINLKKPGELVYMALNYEYMNDGALDSLEYWYCEPPCTVPGGPSGTATFEYDDLNRLTGFDDTYTSTSIQYTYDSVGNRQTKVDGDGTFEYDYTDYTNRLESIDWLELGVPFPYYEFEYDDNGNLIKKTENYYGSTSCFEYDDTDQLIAYRYTDGIPPSCQETAIIEEYFYDIGGKRTMKVNADRAEFYGYSGMLPVLVADVDTGQTVYFVWANGMLIGEFDGLGDERYYHQDTSGNVRVVTDDSSPLPLVHFRTNYLPFGKQFETLEVEGAKFGYGGKEVDEQSGLHYFGVRYYDQELGRFISEDPVRGKRLVPQTLNQYAFALNNPLMYTDPIGSDILADIGNFLADLVITTITLPARTYIWLIQAPVEEQIGFLMGVLFALGVGIAIGFAVGFFCGATFGMGCPFAIMLLGGLIASLAGSIVSGLTYVAVTGGTGSQEGLALSLSWGSIAGGVGFQIGYPIGVNKGIDKFYRNLGSTTPHGRHLSKHAVEDNMDRYRITGEMVDEVAETGQVFFDPKHGSNVYVKSVADMVTGRPIGGNYILVAENPSTGLIANTFPLGKILTRLIPR